MQVEVLPSGRTGSKFFRIFFLEQRSKITPSKSSRWDSQLTSFQSKLALAKLNFPFLSFKKYYWVDRPRDRIDTLEHPLPHDGLVFGDYYGIVSAFWKPYDTVDLRVLNLSGVVGGKLTVLVGNVEFLIPWTDKFVGDGIYECHGRGSSIFLLMIRRDKTMSSDRLPSTEDSMFDFDRFSVVDPVMGKMNYLAVRLGNVTLQTLDTSPTIAMRYNKIQEEVSESLFVFNNVTDTSIDLFAQELITRLGNKEPTFYKMEYVFSVLANITPIETRAVFKKLIDRGHVRGNLNEKVERGAMHFASDSGGHFPIICQIPVDETPFPTFI